CSDTSGTRFRTWLLRTGPQRLSYAGQPRKRAAFPRCVDSGREVRVRILVIEDEARIQAFLARGLEAEGYTVMAAGNGREGVVLEVAGRQAGVDGRTADLSDREFRLLHHLLVHVGEVVSRERLLAEVWGYDFDPGSNVVDVCVRRLRQKLGPDAPIETVRHAGYRLAAA